MTIRQYIQRYILLKIVSGEWGQDSTLPSENQLAKKFSCSRIIARQALTTFVAAGILQPQKGRGYVIISAGVQDFLESNSQKYNSIKEKVEWLKDEDIAKHYEYIKDEYINKTKYLEDFNIKDMSVMLKEYYDEKGLVCVQITYFKKDLIKRIGKQKIRIGKQKIEKSFSKSMVEHAVVPTSKRKEFFPANDCLLQKYKKELGWHSSMITSICQLFMENELLEVSAKLVRRDAFYIRTKQEILL